MHATIRHTIATLLFQKYLPAKARNVTHNITLVLLKDISRELFCQRTVVLGNKAHEISYQHLGITRSWLTPDFGVELISGKITCKKKRITQNIFWKFNSITS